MSLVGKSKQLTSSECASVLAVLLFALIGLVYVSESFSSLTCSLQDTFFFYDFQLRYNEVRCLLSGVDPFKVWRGEVLHAQYSAWYWYCPSDVWHEYVHAYPPWSYSFFLPFALLPKQLSALCWLIVSVLCGASLYIYAFLIDREPSRPLWMRLAPVIAALPILSSVCMCIGVLNYGLIISAAVLAMAMCLDHDRQWLAGVFLSLAMVKPQIGLLFVVPLLVGRKFKAVLIGGVICIVASIPPALLCGESVIDMILSIKEYGAAYSQCDMPTGTFFPGRLPGFGSMVIDAIVGVMSCATLSWLFRDERNWVVRLIPASILCVMWTVARQHDYCIYIIPFFVLARMVVESSRRLDAVSACILPYCCFIICRGIGLQLIFSTSAIVSVGLVLYAVALCVLKGGSIPRFMLLVAAPMAILATSLDGLVLDRWTLVYLLMAACMSKTRNPRLALLLFPVPLILLASGAALPAQTVGWLIIVLLFVLGVQCESWRVEGTQHD